ncbi:hypothetical protein OG897_10475 [Streptomyces sp. NBC_00237]|uniref:hypothetical protein n=1 Tax=Streptomyces sp. NBC_00237 TaxID=2975687 RepID=UPI00225741EF|nr:hypothetical protein [Streptomyces sp. NBC_00237]MCX5201874.1 hypothetical protein [Streptomyces sp. NBC_00237]
MPSTARAWLAALTAEYGTEGTLHVPHEPTDSPEGDDEAEPSTTLAELSERVADYNRQRRLFGGR